MMSYYYNKVVSLVVAERFGPVVVKVVDYLSRSGSVPLLHITKSTQLPLSKVKEALCVLIKYRLVSFTPNKNPNIANYTLVPETAFLMLRYPKYLNLIKKKFGEESEVILEETLQQGYCTASDLIVRTANRLNATEEKNITLAQVKEKLISLIVAKYLIRMPTPDGEAMVPDLTIHLENSFSHPSIDLKILQAYQLGNITADQLPDKDIHWTTNFDRFHQDMRDKLIVTGITNRLDENAGEFVKLLLQQMYIRTEPWASASNPIPVVEVKDIVRKQNTRQQLLVYFDQYITLLEQDSNNIIRNAGKAGGGSLQIDMQEAFTLYAWDTIEQVILEKFDTKAARIFKLVRDNQYIDPDKIQQLAKVANKEAKHLSYLLYEHNFLQLQEERQSSSGGTNKFFYVFYVRLNTVVNNVLEMCYKTLFNMIIRRNHEKERNKRIIDKKQRVDTIAMGLSQEGATEEQLSEIEELITPPERETLERIEKTLKKLNTAELVVDDTIFTLQMYLKHLLVNTK